MDATVRRTRTRPMKTKSRTKDTFIEKTVIQLVVSIMVLCVCIAARYGGVLAAEREQLSLLLRQDTDVEMLLPKVEAFVKQNEYLAPVWNALSPELQVEQQTPAESPAPTAQPQSAPSAAEDPEAAVAVAKNQTDAFLPPLMGIITSNYGDRPDPLENDERFHTGVDIAADNLAPIVASSDGEVIFSGQLGGYGNAIKIRHPNGYVTLYGHCDTLLAAEGDQVNAGQQIALAGSTGRSTGPHLHFDIIDTAGNYIDPNSLMSFEQKQA